MYEEDDHWRRWVAERGWWLIYPRYLNDRDLEELRLILEAIVPEVERGDGLQTFRGRVRHLEIDKTDQHLATAGALLEEVYREQARRRRPSDAPPEYYGRAQSAIELAVATLEQSGLRFRGADATFIERVMNGDVLDGDHIQVDAGRGQNLVDAFMSQSEEFERNTPVWHALNIVVSKHQVEQVHTWQREADAALRDKEGLQEPVGMIEKRSRAVEALGVDIGESLASLKLKPFDRFTLQGMRSNEGAQAGGKARSKADPEVLAEMEKLVREGMKANSAADVVRKRFPKKKLSQEAVRWMWRAHGPRQ